jgi:hypothetical protein
MKQNQDWAWWFIPVIPALGRQRHEFEAGLGYNSEIQFQKKKEKEKRKRKGEKRNRTNTLFIHPSIHHI